MGIKKLTPTCPARRYQTYLTNDDLTTDKPYKPLLTSKKRTSGRNNDGHITVRRRGGGQSVTTGSSISSEIRRAFRLKSRPSSTIRIGRRASLCSITPTARSDTSSRRPD